MIELLKSLQNLPPHLKMMFNVYDVIEAEGGIGSVVCLALAVEIN